MDTRVKLNRRVKQATSRNSQLILTHRDYSEAELKLMVSVRFARAHVGNRNVRVFSGATAKRSL